MTVVPPWSTRQTPFADALRRDRRNRIRRRLRRAAHGVRRGEIRERRVELVGVHVQLHVIDVAVAQTRLVGERQQDAAVAGGVGPSAEAGGEVHLTDVGMPRRPAYPRRQPVRRERRGELVAFLQRHVDDAARPPAVAALTGASRISSIARTSTTGFVIISMRRTCTPSTCSGLSLSRATRTAFSPAMS